MGVPLYIKGVVMIISFGGREYVGGQAYTVESIRAAYIQGLRNGKWEVEKKHKLEVTVEPQYHYDKGYDAGHKDGVNFGHTKGYAEGRSDACKWFEEKSAEIELVANNQGYEEGFDDGFDKGCDTAIKEMLYREELGETTECMFGAVEYCCEHHNPNKESQEAIQEVLDKDDAVSNPKHYNSDPSGVKCIEITRHRNNNIGNVIKYLWRNGLKDGNSNIQDLEKGAWYLNDEIQRLKGLKNGLE